MSDNVVSLGFIFSDCFPVIFLWYLICSAHRETCSTIPLMILSLLSSFILLRLQSLKSIVGFPIRPLKSTSFWTCLNVRPKILSSWNFLCKHTFKPNLVRFSARSGERGRDCSINSQSKLNGTNWDLKYAKHAQIWQKIRQKSSKGWLTYESLVGISWN